MTGGIIALGQELVTHTGAGRCRLGLVVEASDGAHVGLTARHILDLERDGGVFDAQAVKPLGRRIEGRQPLRDGDEFFEAIGAFAIDEEVWSSSHLDLAALALPIVGPGFRMGDVLLKDGFGREFVRGVLHGFGGSVEFVDPASEQPVVLRNVIEASFEEEGFARGEAGCLVTTATGEALALLIARAGEVSYLAPILPFIEKYGYHEAGIDLSPDGSGSVDAAEELAWDFRLAALGAEQLRADIRSENTAATNPLDEPLSPHQLSLLHAG